VNVDPVEERAADPGPVPLELRRGASAAVAGVTQVPRGNGFGAKLSFDAPILRANELRISKDFQDPRRSGWKMLVGCRLRPNDNWATDRGLWRHELELGDREKPHFDAENGVKTPG
jgi:hypothetical protein